MRRIDVFHLLAVVSTLLVVGFILLPLVEMIRQPTAADLKNSLADADVRRAIRLSTTSGGAAALIAFVFGTPLPISWPAAIFRASALSRAWWTCPS